MARCLRGVAIAACGRLILVGLGAAEGGQLIRKCM
jgi:hypothetical protein